MLITWCLFAGSCIAAVAAVTLPPVSTTDVALSAANVVSAGYWLMRSLDAMGRL